MACCVEVVVGQGVEDEYVEVVGAGVVLEQVGVHREVDGPDAESGLGREVEAEVGLRHGGRRMVCHGGLPVEPVDCAGLGGEVVAEDCVAAEVGLCCQEGNRCGTEDRAADFEGATEAAEVR